VRTWLADAEAAGALHTPALLRRSGLANEHIGKHLRVQPAAAVWGVLDREVKPWEGVLQAIHGDEHTNLDGKGYGVRYQTAPIHPGFFVTFAPWEDARHHASLVELLSHTAVVGVLIRDRDGGEVRVGKDGEPTVRYRLSAHDAGHMRRGLDGGAELLEAAGAQRIYASQARYVGYEPGRNGDRASYVRGLDAVGYGPGQIQLMGFHLLGSCRMGGSAATSACGPEAETWDVRDLVVCDGSAFPTASGVNPNMSIQALAHLNATRLAARLA